MRPKTKLSLFRTLRVLERNGKPELPKIKKRSGIQGAFLVHSSHCTLMVIDAVVLPYALVAVRV
jgi:hypothetical protein